MKNEKHVTVKTVGFPIAKTQNGERIKACDAISGEMYVCLYCDCPMFLKISSRGTPFFAKYPGKIHEKYICKYIDQTGTYHSFSESESPDELIASLIQPPVPRGTRGKVDRVPGETIEKDNEEREEGPVVLPFKSLRQIYNYGKFHDFKDEKCGNYKISDYYIHYTWMEDVLNKTSVLGARIVDAKFDFNDFNSKALVFRVYRYSSSQKKQLFQVKFRVKIPNDAERIDFFKKLWIQSNDEKDKMKPPKINSAVLASTKWELYDKRECDKYCLYRKNCENCRGMYYTEYISKKQIEVIHED